MEISVSVKLATQWITLTNQRNRWMYDDFKRLGKRILKNGLIDS